VSPEDHEASLAADRERRLNDIVRDLRELEQEHHASQAGIGKLAETQAAQRVDMDSLHQSVRDLRDDVKVIRDGQRTLVMVLVGFAFTVAGSAIGLALALGGHT
jgi:uncharacterized membrane protein YccC